MEGKSVIQAQKWSFSTQLTVSVRLQSEHRAIRADKEIRRALKQSWRIVRSHDLGSSIECNDQQVTRAWINGNERDAQQ